MTRIVAEAVPHRKHVDQGPVPLNLHVYPSSFRHESRILRETAAVVAANVATQVWIAATWEDGQEMTESLDGSRDVCRIRSRFRVMHGVGVLRKLLASLDWQVRVYWRFRKGRPAIVTCHSLAVLPLGCFFKLLHGSRVVYSAHELETEVAGSVGMRRRVAKVLESSLVPFVDAIVVVNESIRQWYERRYHRSAYVVRSIPAVAAIVSRSRRLRDEIGLDQSHVIFVYVGNISIGRGVHILLEAFCRAPSNRHLVFIGWDENQVVATAAKGFENVHYHEPVASADVIDLISGADVGIALIEDVCLSYFLCLPNKVMEYLVAGLPVIVSDFPEMGRLVDEWRCGWKVAVDVDAVAALVAGLTTEALQTAGVGARAFAESTTWEAEQIGLVAAYRVAISGDQRAHL